MNSQKIDELLERIAVLFDREHPHFTPVRGHIPPKKYAAQIRAYVRSGSTEDWRIVNAAVGALRGERHPLTTIVDLIDNHCFDDAAELVASLEDPSWSWGTPPEESGAIAASAACGRS